MPLITDIIEGNKKAKLPLSKLIYKAIEENLAPVKTAHLNEDLYMATRFKIKNKSGKLINLIQNKAQYNISRNLSGRDLLVKARQLGFSTYFQSKGLMKLLRGHGVNIVSIANDAENTAHLVDIFDILHENLPIQEQPPRKGRYPNGIKFPTKRSTVYIGTAGNRTWGRGKTVHHVHASEIAYWPDPKRTLDGLMESVPDVPEIDTSVVLESTANGASGFFFDEAMKASKGQGIWRLHFYAWWWDEGYYIPLEPQETIKYSTEEEQLIQRVLREDGIRLTEGHIKWRRRKLDSLNETFFQEYPERLITAFLTSGRPRFDLIRLQERLNSQVKKPIYQDYPHFNNGVPYYQLRIYEKAIKNRDYVIGADTAEGIQITSGGETDFCAAVVRDRKTNKQVATIHGRFEPVEFALLLAEIGKYYNYAKVGVERNNHGHAVLGHLLSGTADGTIQPYPNIYIHIEDDRPGWPTTAKTRPLMLSELAAEYKQPTMYQILDEAIISEAISFIIYPNGKAMASPGAFDDLVMADAIACMMRVLPEEEQEAVYEPVPIGHF